NGLVFHYEESAWLKRATHAGIALNNFVFSSPCKSRWANNSKGEICNTFHSKKSFRLRDFCRREHLGENLSRDEGYWQRSRALMRGRKPGVRHTIWQKVAA